MKRLPLFLLIFLIVLPGVQAQSSYTSFTWDFAGVSLLVPMEWDSPQSLQVNGQETLQLAQTLAADPLNRSPETPYITLILQPVVESPDIFALVSTELRNASITPSGPIPATLFEESASSAAGLSADGLYYGAGTGAVLPDGRILLVIGRAPATQRDSFSTIYDAVVTSLRTDVVDIQDQLTYGVLWQTLSTAAEGESAFLDIGSMALTADNTLYLADGVTGLVELDSKTGSVQQIIPFDDYTEPDSIAISPDGTVYVADLLCNCVTALQDDTWQIVLDGFDVNGPRSIAITPDGTLYATDEDVNGYTLRTFTAGTIERQSLDISLAQQPLLAVNALGQLNLLTDDGIVYVLDNDIWVETVTLFPLPETYAFTFNTANNAVLATEEGVIIYDADGNEYQRVGEFIQDYPTYGEYVSLTGVAVGDDGTIYWSDSDASFGSAMAFNTRVQSGRIGPTQLIPGLGVIGQIDDTTPEQAWTFDGLSGETITITVVTGDQANLIDPILTIFDPTGAEIASNDDDESGLVANSTDSRIENLRLPQDGIYTALVGSVSGGGVYTLGLSTNKSITLNESGVTQVFGQISEAFLTERWTIAATAGQTYTITVEADIDSTLDPIVRIYTPQGTLDAENDDAEDATFGSDSQIVGYRIPANGTYIIEVSGFSGDGGYTLQIEQQS